MNQVPVDKSVDHFDIRGNGVTPRLHFLGPLHLVRVQLCDAADCPLGPPNPALGRGLARQQVGKASEQLGQVTPPPLAPDIKGSKTRPLLVRTNPITRLDLMIIDI